MNMKAIFTVTSSLIKQWLKKKKKALCSQGWRNCAESLQSQRSPSLIGTNSNLDVKDAVRSHLSLIGTNSNLDVKDAVRSHLSLIGTNSNLDVKDAVRSHLPKRPSLLFQIYEGTAQIQRLIIGRELIEKAKMNAL